MLFHLSLLHLFIQYMGLQKQQNNHAHSLLTDESKHSILLFISIVLAIEYGDCSVYVYTDRTNIEAIVNGELQTIINKVLRVPYFSNIDIYCQGPGILSWQYRSSVMPPTVMASATNYLASYHDKEHGAVITISNFNRDKMGFYSCSSWNSRKKENETILITSGK